MAVDVTIGANIDRLIAGMQAAGESVTGFAEQVATTSEALKGLGETILAAFAVREIAEFAEKIADMGEKAINASQSLGMTVETVTGLNAAFALTGISGEAAIGMLERLEKNLETAQAGSVKQRDAFLSLGISMQDLKGKDPTAVLFMIADAMEKTQDGSRKTADAIVLLGRAGANMIPALDRGSAGLQELYQKAQDAGVVLTDETAAGMRESAEKMHELGQAILGIGIQAFTAIKPFIDTVVESLIAFAHGIRGVIHDLQDTASVVQNVRINEIMTEMQALTADIENQKKKIADAQAAWTVWPNLSKRSIDAQIVELHKLEAEYDALAKKLRDTQNAGVSYGSEFGPPVPPAAKAQPGALPNEAAIKRAQAQEEAFQRSLITLHEKYVANESSIADDQYRIAKAEHDKEVELIKTKFTTGQITLQQETAELIQAENTRWAAELAKFQQEMDLNRQNSVAFQKMLSEKEAAEREHAKRITQIEKDAAAQTKRDWEQSVRGIESAFSQGISGMISGTMTFQQAVINMGNRIVEDMVSKVIKKIVDEWILGEATKAAASQTSALSTLTDWVASIFGVTTAKETAATTDLAVQTAATVEQGAQRSLTVMGLAALSAAEAFSAMVGIPYVGPAIAPVAAATAFAEVAAFAPLAALDVGAWEVPKTMPALLHAGESVVPADFASGMRANGGFGGGGVHLHFDVKTFDAQSFHAYVQANARSLAMTVSRYMQMNPSARPAY